MSWFHYFVRSLLTFVTLTLIFSRSGYAQQDPNIDTGLKPYGAFHGGDIDSVILTNGKLNLHVPILSYPQRGGKLHVGFFMNYPNHSFSWEKICAGTPPTCKTIWFHSGGGVEITPDFVTRITGGLNQSTGITTYIATTADGSAHQLNNTADGFLSLDATGYHYDPNTLMLIDHDGVRTFGSSPSTGSWVPAKIEDPNGNFLTSTLNTTNVITSWTDTFGRVIPTPPSELGGGGSTSTTDFTGCTGPLTTTAAYLWSTPGVSGGTMTFKVCVADVQINYPTSGCSISANCYAVNAHPPAIQSVVLPNNTAWTFKYNGQGDLSEIDFPTGGLIGYGWTPSSFCGSNANSSTQYRSVIARVTNSNDGTGSHQWSYAGYAMFLNTIATPVTVTDPLGNQTVHTFSNFGTCDGFETETQTYQSVGGTQTIQETVNTDFSYATNPFNPGQAINVVPIRVTTTWPNGQVAKTEKTYDAGTPITGQSVNAIYGNVLEDRTYDFGSSATGPLLKRVDTSYLALSNSSYLTNNLLTIPASITTYDGAGNQVAATTYGYDQSTLASSGISTQHDSNSPAGTYRGNQTSVSRWLNNGTLTCQNGNSGGSGSYVKATSTFFDTGTLQAAIDPCGNNTSYSYSSSYAGALPTTVTNALNQSTSHAYDFNTGLLTSTTDANNLTSSFSYDNMWRLLQVIHPDGGQDNITRQESSFPFSTTLTTRLNSSQSKITTEIFDGFGRVTQTQLTSDPDGTTFTDVAYDGGGRVRTQSNPHRSASAATDGTTTTFYDALGRVCLVVPPDGTLPTGGSCPTSQPSNTIFTTYSGNTTTVTDQAGKSRKSVADGLGRLTQVFEDPAGLNYETDYTYDALNNLLTVNQKGNDPSSANWRTRTFIYDSLSRLLTATNPESGAISYSYDANGNLATKTSPKPNQTGTATVVATYTYDALNRLTQKSFNDGTTPPAQYIYDGNAAPAGCTFPTLTITNPIGRRTGMCDVAGSEVWAYDSLGRVLFNQRKTNGITKQFAYTYSLDGSVATLTHPSTSPNDVWPTHSMPLTFTQGGAGRYTSLYAGTVGFAYNVQYSPSGAECYWKQNWGSITTTNITFNNRLQPMRIYESADSGVTSPTPCQAPTVGTNLPMDFIYNYTDASGHNNGNVQQITNNTWGTRSQTFTYDSLNRLASAQTTGTHATDAADCWSEAYSYDPWGNLLKLGPSGSSSYTGCSQESGFDFSAPGMISTKNQIAAGGYGYDAAGNLTTNPGVGTQTFNAENQLVAAGGQTYAYDGDGNRIWKAPAATPNSPTWIYWYGGSGSSVLQESDGSGNGQYSHIYFNGRRASRIEWTHGGFNDHYGYDALGNVRWVYGSSSSGSSVWDVSDYYPFGGERRVMSGTNNDFKFTYKERDSESGLDNFGARFDSSTLGRFMSADPDNAGADLIAPQSWNAYTYVLNNPMNAVDPTGLDCVYIDNDTGAQTGFNRGDCDNSTEEKANSGYYVDGTVDTSTIRIDGNWVSYAYKPDASPVTNVQAQCWGNCPSDATIVTTPIKPIIPGPPFWDRVEAWGNRANDWAYLHIAPTANVISAFTGLDPSYNYCGPAEEHGPEGADHPKEQTKADEDLNNIKEVKDSSPKRPGQAPTRNPNGSANAQTVGALSEVPGLINNGARCAAYGGKTQR